MDFTFLEAIASNFDSSWNFRKFSALFPGTNFANKSFWNVTKYSNIKTLRLLDETVIHIIFYWNGKKENETTFRHHEKNGKYTSYFDDGTIATQGYYKDNLKNGAWTTWYFKLPDEDNRQIASKEFYRNGVEDGFWERWNRDGSKSLEGSFFRGVKTGVWNNWRNGRLTVTDYS
jgi:antitoxin component YwqK of YwqJK toxin-antitoxin module